MNRRTFDSPWFSAALAIVFFAFVALFSSYRTRFELDSDEANNLMKGLLMTRGFSLGRDIWTDQPPLISLLLAGLGRVTDFGVGAARTLILAFAALAVFATADAARRVGRAPAALATALLLVSSARFGQLSVSVMVGLPAVALAAVSVWALDGGRRALDASTDQRRGTLLFGIAGAAFAFSLAAKLFTAFLAPLFGGVLLLVAFREAKRTTFRLSAQTTLLPFVAAFTLALALGFAPLLRAQTLSGLVRGHAVAREATSAFGSFGATFGLIAGDKVLFAAALLGLIGALFARESRWLSVWTLWLLGGVLALANHRPVWPHHVTLLTIPGSVLAGTGLSTLFDAVVRRLRRGDSDSLRRELVLVLVAGAFGISVFVSFPERAKAFRRPVGWSSESQDLAIHREFSRYASLTERVAASRPMHAFRLKKSIPPDQAVTSGKRFSSGLLKAEKVAKDIARYRPGVVLLSERWPSGVRRAVTKQLSPTHRLVKRWRYQSHELWVERSLAEQLPDPLPDAPEKPRSRSGGRAGRPRP